MKYNSLVLCLAAALLLLAACAPAPKPEATTEADTGPTIEGVWTLEEREIVGGPNEGVNSSPQPSLLIFTKRHYSVMFVSGTEPRPQFQTQPPSEAEIVQAYNTFTANAGTYDLDGSNFVLRPSVAKSPNAMAGGSTSFEYKLEGNTLFVVYKPSQGEVTEVRDRYRRLE